MIDKQFKGYDPRKAEYNGIKIEDWEPSQWKKWKPHATGSPADYVARVERNYLRIKYSVQLANTELDTDKVRVKLKLTSPSAIGLQGTFPCKPGDTGKNGSPNKQYTISLGVPATDAGVKDAKTWARELDRQLWTKTFQWTPELLGKQAQKIAPTGEEKPAKLISELIEEYENEYWKTHERNRQGIENWRVQYHSILKKLDQNVPLAKETIIKAIETTKPNTPIRNRVRWRLKKFCEFCGFNEVDKIIDSYVCSKIQSNSRKIPSDVEIIQGFEKIGKALPSVRPGAIKTLPEQWQWMYGMLATYGLRPHELFAIELEAFIHPSNTLHLVTLNPELTDGTKTGKRKCGIPPLHPEWVKIFDLKSQKIPRTNGTINNKVAKIGRRFRATNIGFKPYDLRHAYAIRGHRLRIPIKTMSDYMGHTVEEHTETYQKWMDEEVNIEIYKEVVIQERATTKEELKAENESLKARIAELEAENESLRQLLIEHQLDGLSNR